MRNFLKRILPSPVQAEHGEYSMILSARDAPSTLSPQLLQVSLRAIEHAACIDIGEIEARGKQALDYGNIWPGEHYRLLMGFALALQPKLVIEIGTSTGLSALSLKQALPPDGRLVTFDIMPWTQYPDTLFTEKDFEDPRLVQYVDDVSLDATMQKYAALLREASLIFIDATHDGKLEQRILENLKKIPFRHRVFILFDDIRVWTMLKMWREISLPKIDLTSFGHWSGTGLVQIDSSSGNPH